MIFGADIATHITLLFAESSRFTFAIYSFNNFVCAAGFKSATICWIDVSETDIALAIALRFSGDAFIAMCSCDCEHMNLASLGAQRERVLISSYGTL